MGRVTLAAATLVALLVASAAVGASTDRPATSTERHAIDAAIRTYWCTYLPRDLRPCSHWKLKVGVHRVSSNSPAWALAQFDASGGPAPADPAKPEVGTFQNVFLYDKSGKWVVTGAFQSLVYNSCSAAAAGTHVPLSVLDDFGLCEHLAVGLGG